MRLLACIVLGLLAANGFAATTYHVAATGSDLNPGTVLKPFRTIQHGCDIAANGDTVMVAAGRYRESVVIKSSILLEAASTSRPLLDGTGIAVTDMEGLISITNLDKVTVQGFEIANYRTTNSNAVPLGIYVHGKCDSITIRGNLIHHIENNGADASSINAFGLAVYGDSALGRITNLVIDGNEIHDTRTGNSETLTVNGNVDGFKVTNNKVHNVNNIGIDAIGFEGTSPIPGEDQARNGIFEGNVVTAVSSGKNPSYGGQLSADGIYIDGGKNIVVQRNIMTACDLGLEVTSEHLGRVASGVLVRNNLLYSNLITGLSIGGYDALRGGTTGCTFVNNTFVSNDTTNSGTGEFEVQYHTSSNIFKNNLLSASAQGILISSLTGTGTSVGVVSDYNLFYAPVQPTWVWNGQTLSSLPNFSKQTGMDKHSLFATPGFVAPAAHNYSLASGSPAIDRGVNLGSAVLGLLDLAGHQRLQGGTVDLGCFEATPKVP